jgi:hypothetical protein
MPPAAQLPFLPPSSEPPARHTHVAFPRLWATARGAAPCFVRISGVPPHRRVPQTHHRPHEHAPKRGCMRSIREPNPRRKRPAEPEKLTSLFLPCHSANAAAGLEGALSSRAVAAGVSGGGGGGGGGGGTARGRQYHVSGGGGYGSAITGAKPPLSKEPAAGNPGFARRVVPAGGGGTGAGGAALQPHPPSSDSHATGRLGSGGGKGAGAHAHKNPGPGASQDALPARQKQVSIAI